MAPEIFRRTAAARLAPLVVAAGAALALVGKGPAESGGMSLWKIGSAVVLAVAAWGALLALGDRVIADDRGLRLRNRLLRREQAVGWDEIRDVRVLRRRTGGVRAVFVFPLQGRRLVLDALVGLDRLAALVRERTGTGGAAPL